MRRRITAGLAACVAALSTMLVTPPAHAGTSPYCSVGITATTGQGSCVGATSGGSSYRIFVTCREPMGFGWAFTTRQSQIQYASPGQNGPVIQTGSCAPLGTPTNAWANSW